MNYADFKSASVEMLLKMGRHSDYAVLAICMIVAHESRGAKYWKQWNNGPARGVIQMERETHDSTWNFADSINSLAEKCGFIRDFDSLEFDLDYNIFMARCRLLMDTNPLPKTPEDMAFYLNDYWNGGGKATPKKYLDDYEDWVCGV